MTQSVNWGELMASSGGSFEPLPNGPYDVKVIKAEPAQTTTGKLMFKMTLKVIAGPHVNRTLWTNQTLSPENPNALAMFFNTMAAFGLDSNFFNTQPSPDAVANALLEKTATVTTTQREWPKGSGTIRNEVASVKKLVGAANAFPMSSPAPAAAPQKEEASIPAPTSDPASQQSGPPPLPF